MPSHCAKGNIFRMSLEVAWTDGEEQAPGPQTVLAVRSPKALSLA